jgi:hypothetical protein
MEAIEKAVAVVRAMIAAGRPLYEVEEFIDNACDETWADGRTVWYGNDGVRAFQVEYDEEWRPEAVQIVGETTVYR